MSDVIAGIEGGGTHSTIVLMKPDGSILSEYEGPSTNHYQLGMDECNKRIADMVNKAKNKAGIPEGTKLKGLGLALSGCEHQETNDRLISLLKSNYPTLSEKFTIASDTHGSIWAVSSSGGVTCIAGTGSNTLLINPDDSVAQCGGYGDRLGDEGSAFKIAHTAIKYCMDHLDGFQESPYPIDTVWKTIKDHFSIVDVTEILGVFYNNFNKAYIAELCKKVAYNADMEDALAKYIFHQAGRDLAKAITSVHKKAHKTLTECEGGLHIVCVGSVWLSWHLLKPGFVEQLRKSPEVKQLTLMKLRTHAAIGAAYMASDRLNIPLTKSYSDNYKVFYEYIVN